MTLTRCWPLAMVMLASQAAFATGTPVVSSTGSYGTLNYRLIDLDPDDGIASAVTFEPKAFVQLYVSDNIANNANQYAGSIENQTVTLNGAPFSASLSATRTLSDGRASVSSVNGDMSGTATYDTAYINALMSSTAAGDFARRYESAFSTLDLSFTLSANTRIEFSSNIDMSSVINVAAAQSLTAHSALDVQAITSALGNVYGDGTFGLSTDTRTSASLLARYLKLGAGGAVVSDTSSNPSQYTDLFLSLSNNTSFSKQANLSMSLSEQVAFTLSPQLAVPEMGTHAMFGLGLMGVVAASLRQRQRCRVAG